MSVLTFAALAYQRRWIADDGMIAVRTARQIVAGHGPVYSPFERAETNTSVLWTWLLALADWSTGADIARLAVYGGLVCSVLGMAIALDATRRFHNRLAGSAGGSSAATDVASVRLARQRTDSNIDSTTEASASDDVGARLTTQRTDSNIDSDSEASAVADDAGAQLPRRRADRDPTASAADGAGTWLARWRTDSDTEASASVDDASARLPGRRMAIGAGSWLARLRPNHNTNAVAADRAGRWPARWRTDRNTEAPAPAHNACARLARRRTDRDPNGSATTNPFGTRPSRRPATGEAANHRRPLLLPAGFLIILGVSPFWDYATSGLESGLAFLWIALCWWLLTAWCAAGPSVPRQYTAAATFGLGPLVRPEFALIGAVFGLAAWLLTRPPTRRTIALLAAAGALPAAYEIFRAGYYGTLVPLPALTKSAGSSAWQRGFTYLAEFEGGYVLWIPLAVLAATLAVYADRHIRLRAERLLLAAPLAAGLLLCVYVLRVGGDFMHARMMLPVTFLLLLPVLLLPSAPTTRLTVTAVTALAVWSASVAFLLPVDFLNKAHAVSEDERIGSQDFTGRINPDASAPYISREKGLVDFLIARKADGTKVLTSEGGVDIPLNPALGFDAAVAAGRLGAAGAATPLDDTVVDTLGLAYPLGARITVTNPGRPGHEKVLPWAWILADYGDPAFVDQRQYIPGVSPASVRAARHAMSCGKLKELIDSTRQPLTAGRFWDNLVGSPGRTTLVVPADPFAAEKKFCG